MARRILAALLYASVSLSGMGLAQAADMTVYKSPTCGCCDGWVRHVRAHGFTVQTRDIADVTPYKKRYGVSPALASCHTAVIGGYAIEGHVPAQDVERLLKERPNISGLAAPGMPSGSPGMSGPRQRYDVVAFDRSGNVTVYARH